MVLLLLLTTLMRLLTHEYLKMDYSALLACGMLFYYDDFTIGGLFDMFCILN
jgi:hypothetical protein